MLKYFIYAGMGGRMGGRFPNLISESPIEFDSYDEAVEYAYQCAVEDYVSYEGNNGILSEADCRKQMIEEGYDKTDSFFDDDVRDRYQEEIESWINYYIEEEE